MKNILRNFQLSLFFKNTLYNQIFNDGIDGKIQYNPESLWKGNKFEGSRIIDGFLNFQKESVFINSNVWHKNHVSIYLPTYLFSLKQRMRVFKKSLQKILTNKVFYY